MAPRFSWRTNLLRQDSKRCLRNLVSYQPKPLHFKIPKSRCAAVLVALFVGRKGDLHVLLSRRSATLRSYAGDTSLPGGKVDPEDKSWEDTARREAYEEIGLPRDRQKVPLLCVLDPFLATNDLIVTPVVVLILDNTLRVEYHTHIEFKNKGPNGEIWPSRVHRFLTGREAGGIKPVFGLTAGILIHAATVGYRQAPDFEVQPPGAPSLEQKIAWAMLQKPVLKEACEAERRDTRGASSSTETIRAGRNRRLQYKL
ncbi:NUDIX hydrolase domain-like protein [Infundibulicybe gibba]|nr:NUDIX hydrolase domain-like protein [Infundibulicybe gibba]